MTAECWCGACEDARLKPLRPLERMLARKFIVCPDCGNKRCPKAQHHERACTRSNEPGQPGGMP